MRPTSLLPIAPKPDGQPPHLFGRGLCDKLLMTLAVNDRPLYATELAVALACDPSKVMKTLSKLKDIGLVADSTPTKNRFVGLNVEFPAHIQLLRLLRALEKAYSQPRFQKPRRRAERLALRDVCLAGTTNPFKIDYIFESPPRTRVLLAATAMKDTDTSDLQRSLAFGNRGTWNIVNNWQREGVIRSTVKGRRRAIELDPSYIAARELRLFLTRLVVLNEEYLSLASLSSRNPKSPMFIAVR